MRLSSIRIQNYRSIVDSGVIRLEPLQGFVGENNAGKSNILRAIELLLTPGTAGMQENAFFDKSQAIVITATFSDLSPAERQALRPHLVGEQFFIEKRLEMQAGGKGSRAKITAEYHGYVAQPADWWLAINKIGQRAGPRPNWKQIAQDHDLLNYVQQADGKVNKKSYEDGLQRLLQARTDIRYEAPTPGATEALGPQPSLLRHLPDFYLLPAITDYSSEIDRRSTSTIFRRLMGDLADRILAADPRFSEIDASLSRIRQLLNQPEPGDEPRAYEVRRLDTLDTIEHKLRSSISRLMPSVTAVRVAVTLEDTRDFFTRGVALKVDDGILTDVLDKGHGLQRSVVFGLLQTLIENQKSATKPIILAIEEPELYIHPQMQRLIFRVLREFAKTDQIIYTTHAPTLIDLTLYERIGVVRKDHVAKGTFVCQCTENVFGNPGDKHAFLLLNSFGLQHNQIFFARRIILVEGEQDLIAITAAGRKLGLFAELPEEIGYTIVVTGSKGAMPKFQTVLNEFRIPYIVLHEMDGKHASEPENKNIIAALNGNKYVKMTTKLEALCGVRGKHFGSTHAAKLYFGNPKNINGALEGVVREMFA